MIQQPTTSERFASLCVLYMIVAIIGMMISTILGVFIELYREQLFEAALFFVWSLLVAVCLWICADSFNSFVVDMREILTTHWKRLTWKEEEVVEE